MKKIFDYLHTNISNFFLLSLARESADRSQRATFFFKAILHFQNDTRKHLLTLIEETYPTSYPNMEATCNVRPLFNR